MKQRHNACNCQSLTTNYHKEVDLHKQTQQGKALKISETKQETISEVVLHTQVKLQFSPIGKLKAL